MLIAAPDFGFERSLTRRVTLRGLSSPSLLKSEHPASSTATTSSAESFMAATTMERRTSGGQPDAKAA